MKNVIKAENVRQVININDLKAKVYDELVAYALEDNADADVLMRDLMAYNNVVEMVNEVGAFN